MTDICFANHKTKIVKVLTAVFGGGGFCYSSGKFHSAAAARSLVKYLTFKTLMSPIVDVPHR